MGNGPDLIVLLSIVSRKHFSHKIYTTYNKNNKYNLLESLMDTWYESLALLLVSFLGKGNTIEDLVRSTRANNMNQALGVIVTYLMLYDIWSERRHCCSVCCCFDCWLVQHYHCHRIVEVILDSGRANVVELHDGLLLTPTSFWTNDVKCRVQLQATFCQHC